MSATDKGILSYPKNTVIVHHGGRASFAPCLSAFTVKLETYLRMTDIPYQNVSTLERGAKGKIPYIFYNGREICDSQFIIEFLNEELGIDLNKQLTAEQRSVARAFQKMFDEHTYWCVLFNRAVLHSDETANFLPDFPRSQYPSLKKLVNDMAYAQGIGRHTEQEVNHILKGDLQSFSNYLGTKKFLMGDRPCEADCSIFGQLAQLKWCCPDIEGKRLLSETFKNVNAYCDRMKETFWPDWDDCTTRGGTTATGYYKFE